MRGLQTNLLSLLTLSSVAFGAGEFFKASSGDGKLLDKANSRAQVAELDTPGLTKRGVIDARQFGSMLTLNKRQALVCSDPEYPVACSNGSTCCPGGTNCCLTTGGCCPLDQDCFGTRQCCPQGSETCGGKLCVDADSVCCGAGEFACQPGAICNTQDGEFCCPSDYESCPGGCCEPGTTCAPGRSGFCVSTEVTTTTRGTTLTTTSSKTSTTRATTVESETEEPDIPTEITTEESPTPTVDGDDDDIDTQESTCQVGSSKKMKRDLSSPSGWTELGLWKRQTSGSDDDDDDVGEFCTVNGKDVPVMVFKYQASLNKAMIENMCKGINRKGNPGNEMALTWAGDGNNDLRRRMSGCEGYCRARQVEGEELTSCDEFPFAATFEGGSGAQIACIPAWQNTLQGIYINGWSSLYGIKAGSIFVVRIEGILCSQFPVTGLKEKRAENKRTWLDANGQPYPDQDDLITISGSGGTATRIPPVGPDVKLNGDMGYYISPLGDVTAGFYSLELRVQGGLADKMKIINGEGVEVAMLDQAINSMTQAGNYTFKVDDIDYGLGVVVYTETRGLTTSFIYTADVKPGNNSEAAYKKTSDASPTLSMQGLNGWLGLFKGVLAIVVVQLVINRGIQW